MTPSLLAYTQAMPHYSHQDAVVGRTAINVVYAHDSRAPYLVLNVNEWSFETFEDLMVYVNHLLQAWHSMVGAIQYTPAFGTEPPPQTPGASAWAQQAPASPVSGEAR